VHLSSRKGGGRGDLFADGPGGADLRQRESARSQKRDAASFISRQKLAKV
jgi:hypothetical protein